MPQNPSCGNPSRLRNYVALAATPAITMSMSSASADVVYQSLDVSIDVGGMGSDVSFTAFDIGGFASVDIVAMTGAPGWVWGLGRWNLPGSMWFASSSYALTRFESGETINTSAIGSKTGDLWLGGGDSTGGKPVNFKVADGTISGYVGFAVLDPTETGAVLFGWISVSWDDVTEILTVDGYAYETDGSGIVAGAGLPPAVPAAPGALGLVALAAGAAGVRRQRAC